MGKPVEWTNNPRYLTRRFSMRTIRLLVSTAGPAMNLFLALFVSVVLVAALRTVLNSSKTRQQPAGVHEPVADVFNLLPIPTARRAHRFGIPAALRRPAARSAVPVMAVCLFWLVLFHLWADDRRLVWLILPFQLLIVKYLHLLHLLAT